MNNEKYLQAKEELLTVPNRNCQQFFLENNCTLELGYYNLLNQQPEIACEYFEQIKDFDVRADWGIFITKLANGKIDNYPTYFELRNFLEIDLDLFLKYFLGEYVENVVNYSDWMSTINGEVNKFIGRVFFKNGYNDWGYIYLKKACDTFYNDPELHYLLAEYYLDRGEIDYVKASLDNCLRVTPEYFPAINLKEKLK